MSKYVVRTDADEQLLRPLPDEQPEAGYLLFLGEDGFWTWLYQEPGEDDEFGPSLPTRADALEDIATNWLSSGGPVPKFVGTVRTLATKARMASAVSS